MPQHSSKASENFEFIVLNCAEAYKAASDILHVPVAKIPKETKIALLEGGFGFFRNGSVRGIAAVKRELETGPIEQVLLVGESLSQKECLDFVQKCLEARKS